jgi:hypothetical protein
MKLDTLPLISEGACKLVGEAGNPLASASSHLLVNDAVAKSRRLTPTSDDDI